MKKLLRAGGVALIIVAILGMGWALTIKLAEDATMEARCRIDCANNLRQLGLSLHQYAGDNREAFPKSLQEIEFYAARQTQLLVCDSSDPRLISAAADFSRIGPTNVSYYYVAGGSLGSRLPTDVLMFSDPDTHQGEGGNILYVGGHVCFHRMKGSTNFWGEPARSGITLEMVAAATNKVIYLDDVEVDS